MTLFDLPDNIEVSVDLVYLLQRLTIARETKNIEVQEIINHAINRLNNFKSFNDMPIEPPMSLEEVKKVFPNYKISPPPLRLFNYNQT